MTKKEKRPSKGTGPSSEILPISLGKPIPKSQLKDTSTHLEAKPGFGKMKYIC